VANGASEQPHLQKDGIARLSDLATFIGPAAFLSFRKTIVMYGFNTGSINPVEKRHDDAFHDSPELVDEAVNIRTGTAYLQALISKNSAAGASSPVAEAYKDYRVLRNGIYYNKI
jgi:hypothetical protein